jgi:lipoate-protein ligase A
MALDEALWENANIPALRLYEWDHLALSFGYFGRYQDVASYEGRRELVRRCTGGGIVQHGDDLTYALIIPASHFIAQPLEIYTLVHRVIQDALIESGLPAILVSAEAHSEQVKGNQVPQDANFPSPNDSYACFGNPVVSDVLVDGVKVAGAAQRRSRRGLLQQGSIQNVRLAKEFRDRFARHLSPHCFARDIDVNLLEKAGQLVANKYGIEAWLRRR